MKKTSRLVAALAAGALALGLAACSPGSNDAGSTTGSSTTAPLLTLGQIIEPTSFDPAVSQEGNSMPYYQAVYDTLIKRAPDGTLEPMLATEWTYNDDRTALTLTLRDDVTFSDGAAFDADGAKANIEHFLEAKGPQANQAASITSVEATDATTLVITLSAPDPSLEYSLASSLGFMASPDAIGSEDIASTPVGSGPYTLDSASTIVGSEYTFVRNADYWGDALPYDSIKFVLLTDETARVNALRSGQINAAVFTAPSTAQELESSGFTVEGQLGDFSGFVFFDRTGQLNPAFADPRVREALTISIDKEALLENVGQGRGELTNQIFPSDDFSYDKALDTDDRFAYDPDRAKQLLADAGYASGLTVTMPISPVFDPSIYTTIEQNFSDIGVTMERVEFGPGQTIPALLGGQFAITYFTLATFNDWTTVRQYLAPDAPWNSLKTEDADLAELIKAYQYATTDDERTTAGQAMNEYVVDNNWFGVFSRVLSTYGHDDTVSVELQTQQAVPSIYNYSPAN